MVFYQRRCLLEEVQGNGVGPQAVDELTGKGSRGSTRVILTRKGSSSRGAFCWPNPESSTGTTRQNLQTSFCTCKSTILESRMAPKKHRLGGHFMYRPVGRRPTAFSPETVDLVPGSDRPGQLSGRAWSVGRRGWDPQQTP